MNPTKKELQILYTLINYHLNTIGSLETYINPRPERTKGDYMWEMEKLEKKIEAAAFGLKKY
jgi:hypothetical protein